LVFKVHFNCCKVEGHHLTPQMKNVPDDTTFTWNDAKRIW